MDWVYRGEYATLAEQIETLFAVSGTDVLDTSRSCDLSRTTLLTLGPAKEI